MFVVGWSSLLSIWIICECFQAPSTTWSSSPTETSTPQTSTYWSPMLRTDPVWLRLCKNRVAKTCGPCGPVGAIFFWPVLILGKSTRKTGENTRKQAKTRENRRKTGAFLVLIFLGEKLVGANFYAFCNYAFGSYWRASVSLMKINKKNRKAALDQSMPPNLKWTNQSRWFFANLVHFPIDHHQLGKVASWWLKMVPLASSNQSDSFISRFLTSNLIG